jgi:hypothetical protein
MKSAIPQDSSTSPAGGGKDPMKITTGVRVNPDTLPFEAPKFTPPVTGQNR